MEYNECRTFPCRDASRSPPGVSCPASQDPLQIVDANGWLGGVVASCVIAAPPRSYVSWRAPASEHFHPGPVDGLRSRSAGARLSGVRWDGVSDHAGTCVPFDGRVAIGRRRLRGG